MHKYAMEKVLVATQVMENKHKLYALNNYI